jgi:hypothetical protein
LYSWFDIVTGAIAYLILTTALKAVGATYVHLALMRDQVLSKIGIVYVLMHG